jgi:hypothetical protein
MTTLPSSSGDRSGADNPRAVGALLVGIDGLLQAFWTELLDSRMAIPSELEERVAGGRIEQVCETQR